jgi:hypothetical protein
VQITPPQYAGGAETYLSKLAVIVSNRTDCDQIIKVGFFSLGVVCSQ